MNLFKGQYQRLVVMIAVFIATFMTSVEVTIVTTALPQIISELHGLASQSWIMSAYLLTTAITTPIYGKLADNIGRKPVFQWGVVLFTLGSLLSGLAANIEWLIAARLIQGIGAGAVMPLTFTIIADYFSFEQRAQVLAMNNTAWALSALIGPLLGGFLVDQLSWHWVFFVNVPLGIVVLVLIALGYSKKETMHYSKQLTLDWQGITFLTISLLCILLAAQNLNRNVLIASFLLIIAFIALWLLFRVEHRSADPLINPQMFANKTFTVQVVTTMLLSGVLISYQIYFPIWLQSIYHFPAARAGMVVSSSSIMWLVASFFVGSLISRFVPKQIAIVIVIAELIFYGMLIAATPNFPAWMFYVIAAVNGTGMGIVISMNTILAQHLVASDLVGSASGMITLGRSLGQTLMTGIYGAVFNLLLALNRGNVAMSTLNHAVSATHFQQIKNQALVSHILLSGLHAVFGVVVLLLVLVLIFNIKDPNRKIIK
ncbi:MFS transporter [Bombilactobacillus bombi]|uniref:MFS transporter n=1 Tax=Bombilactobacillus bombi TaxID=1303590 RepID=UPI0015E5D447|nr:MFS transporter [Bombilactobacillus bombi]MBA1434603.1 MFS transporter [Bombilactobacillus bombi]